MPARRAPCTAGSGQASRLTVIISHQRPDGPTAGRFSFLGHGMATELKCCSCDDDLDLIELVVEPDAEPIVICKGCVEDMFNRVFAAPAVH